jgi:hypothetical protein
MRGAIVTLGTLLLFCGQTTPSTSDAAPEAATCSYADLRTAPERTCSTNSDCAVLQRQSDCCGTLVEEGVRADQVNPLHNALVAASAACSPCTCVPGMTVDDLGQTGGAYIATCDMGLCTAHAH